MIGHSQGAVITSMMSGYYSDIISKEVLINPAATLVDDARIGTCWGVKYDPCHIPEKIKLDPFTLKGFYFRTAKFSNIYASQHYHAVLPNNEFNLLKGGNHNMDNVRQKLDKLIIDFLDQ